MTRVNDNGTDRNMTAEEKAAYDAWAEVAQHEQAAAQQAAADAAAAAASGRAKLKALGLTDEEIAALGA